MNKKAVFVVGQWSRAGGLEIVTQDYVQTFRDLGFDVYVLVAHGLGDNVEEDKFHVRYFEPQNRILRSLWCRFALGWIMGGKLDKIINEGDVVVLGHARLLGVADHSKVIGKCVSWVWTHGGDVWDWRAVKYAPSINKLTRAISVSHDTRGHLLRGGVKVPVSVILNSIETRKFVPATTPEKIRHDEIMICSRIPVSFEYKGHLRLLDAMLVAEKILGRKISLRVVGKGPGLPKLQQIIKEKGMEDRVICTGFVTDEQLVEAYQHCGVYCMPSDGEGFGLVYAEASSCARPVVVSTIGGAPDTLIPDETGLLADPMDIEANGKAIAKILSDHAYGDELGRKGREFVERSFSFPVFSARIKEVLSEDMPL